MIQRQVVQALNPSNDTDAVEIEHRDAMVWHRRLVIGVCSDRIGFGSGLMPASRQRSRPEVPRMPLGRNSVTSDEQRAQGEQPDLGHGAGQPGLGVVDHDRAERRADQRAAPADRDPDHRLDRIGGVRTRRD
jgi:hypothetical protein